MTRKTKIWLLLALFVAVWFLVSRGFAWAAEKVLGVAKIPAGYPNDRYLTPHYSFDEVWWADALQTIPKWTSPGVPSEATRVVAQACAWIEQIRKKTGDRPIIARCVGFGTGKALFVLYPPATTSTGTVSASRVSIDEILSAAKEVIPTETTYTPSTRVEFTFTGPAGSLENTVVLVGFSVPSLRSELT